MSRLLLVLAIGSVVSAVAGCSQEPASDRSDGDQPSPPPQTEPSKPQAPPEPGAATDSEPAAEQEPRTLRSGADAPGETGGPDDHASFSERIEHVRALRDRGKFFPALREARALVAEAESAQQRGRIKPLLDELRGLNREAGRLRFAVDKLDQRGEQARVARRQLRDSGQAGRLLLRSVVREGEPDAAANAASMLGELGDSGALPDLMDRLPRAEEPTLLYELSAALGELSGAMSDRQAARVWGWMNQWEGDRKRAAAGVLVGYARRAAGADADLFNEAIGETGAYAKLQGFLKQARAAAKEGASQWAARMMRQLQLRWTGRGETNLASDPANWEHNVLPSPNSIIVLDRLASKHMVWDGGHPDLPNSVAGWVQKLGFDGTVQINTTYDRPYTNRFNALTITGDVTLDGGTWTHKANPNGYRDEHDEVYRLRVVVEGDLTLGSEAAIDVSAKGFAIKGFGNGGAAHGGRGGAGPVAPYGSILEPILPGMGGMSGSEGNQPGGGAVRLSVGGTAAIEGAIRASVPWEGGSYIRAAAGGSIWLDAARLVGAGRIEAEGGDSDGGSNAGPGGGGRVAVKLTDPEATFAGFDGTISARQGARATRTLPWAAAGSIFLSPGDAQPDEGRLIVDYFNRPSVPQDASIYPHELTDEDLSKVTIELRNQGRLIVRRDRSFRAIRLVGRGNELVLDNGVTASVTGLEIAGATIDPRQKAYAADELDQVSGGGRIRIQSANR